jgi:PEP-CTERM motif
MRRRTIAFELSCIAFLLLSDHPVVGGQILTPLQTQSTSPPGVLVATDWGPGTNGVTTSLSFAKFNPNLGSLTAIDITVTATIRNDYELIFVRTPTPTTIAVASSQTADPSVLADPTKRSMLSDGPKVTLFAPNGIAQILGPPATRQPVDFVQMTKSSGTWSSLLPTTNPNYIPPTITQQSNSTTLTDSNAHSLFSDFIGTGTLDLPINATAFSSFYSSSGNGGGAVLTKANAIVTVQYVYSSVPEPSNALTSVPEPSSAIILGLGIGISLLASRLRRRVTRPSKCDRT